MNKKILSKLEKMNTELPQVKDFHFKEGKPILKSQISVAVMGDTLKKSIKKIDRTIDNHERYRVQTKEVPSINHKRRMKRAYKQGGWKAVNEYVKYTQDIITKFPRLVQN